MHFIETRKYYNILIILIFCNQGCHLFGECYSGLEYDYRGLINLYANTGKLFSINSCRRRNRGRGAVSFGGGGVRHNKHMVAGTCHFLGYLKAHGIIGMHLETRKIWNHHMFELERM